MITGYSSPGCSFRRKRCAYHSEEDGHNFNGPIERTTVYTFLNSTGDESSTDVTMSRVSLPQEESSFRVDSRPETFIDKLFDRGSKPMSHQVEELEWVDTVYKQGVLLDSGTRIITYELPKRSITWLDTAFAPSTNGCRNNSACDSPDNLRPAEGSTEKLRPVRGIIANTSPEVSKSIGSSTPDSTQSGNSSKSQYCSYLELFNATRKHRHMKRRHTTRENHATDVSQQDNISVRPHRKEAHSVERLKQGRKGPGYVTIFQKELRERVGAALGRLSAKSSRQRDSDSSETTITSTPKDNNGITYSDQFVENMKSAERHLSPKPCTCHPNMYRTMREPVKKKEGLGSPTYNLGQDILNPVSHNANESIQMYSVRMGGIDKVRSIKGRRKTHVKLPPASPDPELVRIYGGQQTISNTHKSQAKKQNHRHFSARTKDSSQEQKAFKGNREDVSTSIQGSSMPSRDRANGPTPVDVCRFDRSDSGKIVHVGRDITTYFSNKHASVNFQSHSDSSKTGKTTKCRKERLKREMILNNHDLLPEANNRPAMFSQIHEIPGQESRIRRGTEADSETLMSVDVKRNMYIKGIMKCQNKTNPKNTLLPSGAPRPDSTSTRKVRFACPERNLVVASNRHARMCSPSDRTLVEDKIQDMLDRGSKYRKHDPPSHHSKIRFQKLDCIGLKSQNLIKEHLQSLGSLIATHQNVREAAFLKRNIPTIQHFRDVGDYDELYPGNGEGTRWNDIYNKWRTLETRAAFASIGAENAFSEPSSVQNGDCESCMTSGGVTNERNYDNESIFSCIHTFQNRAQSIISNGSNQESEDERASGDGYTALSVDNTNYDHQRHEEGIQSSHTEVHKERDHITPMSEEFRSKSLEASRRKKTAVKNLERALQHGVMHAYFTREPAGFKDMSTTVLHNSGTDDRVDVIDRKALEDSVKNRRRPAPPSIRYRNMYHD